MTTNWWQCPNIPPCGHGAILHDIEEPDDLLPTCCADGCECGHVSRDYRRGWNDGKRGRDPDFNRLALGANRLNDYERGYIDSGGNRERS